MQNEGQWELQYMLAMREQFDMYHPSGFNTYLVLPNLGPMYVVLHSVRQRDTFTAYTFSTHPSQQHCRSAQSIAFVSPPPLPPCT